MSEPRLTIEMVKAAMHAIVSEPPRGRRVTFHHPRCRAVSLGKSDLCNCGGEYLPRALATNDEEAPEPLG